MEAGTSTGRFTSQGKKSGCIVFDEGVMCEEAMEKNKENDELKQSFLMLQNLMIKKGVMSKEEIESLVRGVGAATENKVQNENGQKGKKVSLTCPPTVGSSSEATIYKKVVPIVGQKNVNPAEEQVDNFLAGVREETEFSQNRKISTSSEEMMDTSNEMEQHNIDRINSFFAADKQQEVHKRDNPEQQAEKIILEAEHSRARVMDVKGKRFDTDVALIDQDYQMIDAHLDISVKRKIQNLEYIDLGKLVTKYKAIQDEGNQRLEFINKNGFTYLSPVSERDHVQINSYAKWEQAFRVYSNILTSKYPEKATELLQ